MAVLPERVKFGDTTATTDYVLYNKTCTRRPADYMSTNEFDDVSSLRAELYSTSDSVGYACTPP